MGGRTVTAAMREKFLEAIEKGLSIREACKVGGFSYTQQHYERKRDPEFAARFEESYLIGRTCKLDDLVSVATKRAKKASDPLLMFLIKQLDPSFRERSTIGIDNSGGGAINVHITQADSEL